jgi:hypothetical protein
MDVKEEECVVIKFCCKVDILASKTVELIQKPYVGIAQAKQQFLSGTNGFERVGSQ